MTSANMKRQQGLTLIELTITTVILSIAMIALLNAFSLSSATSSDPLWRNKSLKLAQLYLDEVLSKAYDESTPLGGESDPASVTPSCSSLGPEESDREDYDDVDDFDGLDDQPPYSAVASLADYDAYRVQVSVSCDGNTVGALGSSPGNRAKKIQVTIFAPNDKSMTFAAYKGHY